MNISNAFMLARLNVSTWQGRATDKRASAELNVDKKAAANASRVVKNLLAGSDGDLKAALAAHAAVRQWFYANSSPWGTGEDRSGTRLVPASETIRLLQEFTQLKIAAEAALDTFAQSYAAAVQNASVTLGDLYNPDEYPPIGMIKQEFRVVLSLDPVSESADFSRVSIPGAVVKAFADRYEQRLAEQSEAAVADIQSRVFDEIKRMAVQLGKVGAGEKTRLFDSLTGNLKDLVRLARSFGPLDNNLTALAAQVERDLLQHEVKAYKENAALARVVAEKAAAMLPPEPAEVSDFNVDDVFSFGDGEAA